MKVEVLSINTVVDLEDGKPVTAVSFGRIVKVTEAVAKRARTGGTPLIEGSRQLGVTVVQLFYSFGKVVPYRVGSSWNLAVSEDGSVSMKEIKP
ncbi:MAG: hypothetical protein OK449_03305 [Thaumarchaeota archaeon]|nr:hypothetical protein [Nitrososphaerota archaeon]